MIRSITAVVEQIVTQVDEGNKKLSGKSAKEISDLLAGSISKVEITQASVEQAKGVNEITAAMHHLEKATSENSSMAAHTGDCAKNLETNTSDLSSLVNGIETDILGIKSERKKLDQAA